MEVVAEIIRGIAALVLLAALLEMLLPEGTTARFIRVIIGLALIASVILPLAQDLKPQQLTSARELDLTGMAKSADDAETTAEYAAEGAALAATLQDSAMLEYATELSRQAAALATLAEGISTADATVVFDDDGTLRQIELELTTEPGCDPEAAATAAVNLVSGFYLLPSEQVGYAVTSAEETGMEGSE